MSGEAARASGPGKSGRVDETRYAPVAVLEAWFASAQPGDPATIYAIGPALDPAEPAVALVRQWIDARAVLSFVNRHPLTGALLYQCRRKAAMAVVETSPGQVDAAAMAVAAVPALAQRMLAVLTELAEAGAPCPSWAALADLADLRDLQAARYQCRVLEAAGLISIETDGHARVVTIAASGQKTAQIRKVQA